MQSAGFARVCAALILLVFSSAGPAAHAQKPYPDEQSFYEHAHPYLDEPLEKLRKSIPELKKIRPAADPGALPEILRKTGGNVEEFFHDVVDLIAREKITQERVSSRGSAIAIERVEDNYLIMRRGEEEEGANIVEFRMDAEGHDLGQVGADRGFLVTFGYALICNYFSTGFQPQAEFRLLGEERIGTRETYVVGFAQQPGRAKLFVTMATKSGINVHLLMQGIAWVDQSDFQIVRMRTDLLSPRPEVGLEQQTTEVTLSRVQLQDVATPLWLPKEVKVELKIKEGNPEQGWVYERNFRNEHRYADYRRYRVSVKMVTPK